MNKLFLILPFLFLNSCEIERIISQANLTPPQGLTISVIEPPVVATPAYVLTFQANNPESYFTGYTIFVSPRSEDFTVSPGLIVAPDPRTVEGSQAIQLTNYQANSSSNLSIFVGAPLSFPEERNYPLDAVRQNPNEFPPTYNNSSFTSFPAFDPTTGDPIPGEPIDRTVTYYFAVYSYSDTENIFSLPSNIAILPAIIP